jgi:AcrR family transcriptional regulator
MARKPNPLNQKDIWFRKPLQRRSQAKFEAVISALPQVLQQRGWPKTTTAELALEADISIGSLYNYFSCKEAVLLAYLDQQLNHALDTVLLTMADGAMEPADLVRGFVYIGVDFAYAYRQLLKIALQEFPEKILNPDLSVSGEKILQIIEHAARNPGLNLKNRDQQIAVYTLSNIMLGFQFRTVVMPDDSLDRKKIVEELTALITGYLFGDSFYTPPVTRSYILKSGAEG